MNKGARRPDLVLAVHPWSRGMGWAVFESPLSPIDWGIGEAKTNKHVRCMARFERLLERYHPSIVVLETFRDKADRRSARIRRLYRALLNLASNRGIETRLYSRAAIRTCFASVGARTRDEIVQAVVQHIDVFRYRVPPARKTYTSEDARLSLFEAAALSLTHFAVTSATGPNSASPR